MGETILQMEDERLGSTITVEYVPDEHAECDYAFGVDGTFFFIDEDDWNSVMDQFEGSEIAESTVAPEVVSIKSGDFGVEISYDAAEAVQYAINSHDEHVWQNGSIVVEHVEDDVYDLNQWRVNREELHEAETILGAMDSYDTTKVTCTFSGVDYKRTRDTEVVIGSDTFLNYEEFDNLVDAVWEHYDEHVDQ
jgi:hypothetical protein